MDQWLCYDCYISDTLQIIISLEILFFSCVPFFSVLTIAMSGGIRYMHPSHSGGCDISGTPTGNSFKFQTSTQAQWTELIRFWWSKVQVTVTSSLSHSREGDISTPGGNLITSATNAHLVICPWLYYDLTKHILAMPREIIWHLWQNFTQL